MNNSIKIVVPLPPKELSPNSRCHWAVKSKKRKAYKEEVGACCLEQKVPMCKSRSATFQLAFYYKTKCRHDPDNSLSSAKHCIDSITEHGLLSDDDKITYLPLTIGHDKENPRLEITITDLC